VDVSQGEKMKKQFENDDTMEPIGYSVAEGKTIWGKTLNSREITIEEYLKRIDPKGKRWDGSLPLFDFSEEKIIEYIEKFKTSKKANDYIKQLWFIYDFILKGNDNEIPRCINFSKLEDIIKLKTLKKSHSVNYQEIKKLDDNQFYHVSYIVDLLDTDKKRILNLIPKFTALEKESVIRIGKLYKIKGSVIKKFVEIDVEIE